ncbi:hypothetical protein FGG08_005799 [Glutinoglossum americanum]|uniref:Cytochrome b561 domain-containing protein n=1 Tax=Glutinoglossum americanum TaxID=1670608 RepID=A0A9P8HXG9_9PEZI|nr:hypothetical protein FGG08_005799 [Glutinoglossum americanum]
MAPTPQLSPPGSSSYSSDSMVVGDGTWDSQRNTFLLPNLVGLNFETMRYNGMGNRFRDLTQYHSLILAHGVIAAIVFLFIVPTAIMIARFHVRRPAWALRLHVWLQVLTVALTTVLFVLGWFAVGPSRSLTNPHHGIGLAIYVLVLAQAIGGWFVHSREKGKVRNRLPLKLMIHQWSGRFIALLGLAQVPLGLTLYGSPRALFILYTLTVFTLFLFYFVLSYRSTAPTASLYRESNTSGTVITEEHHHSGLGTAAGAAAGAAAAGAGLAAFSRHRHGGERHSGSFIEEKTSRHESGGFMKRVFEGGAALGGLAIAKKFFDSRKDRGGTQPEDTLSDESVSRVEGGRVGGHDRAGALPQRSYSGSSQSSRTSITDRRRGHGKLRKAEEGVATLGALGLLRAAIKGRRERKEQRRVDALRAREVDEERLARRGGRGHRYTGDGLPSRQTGRRGSITTTDYTATTAPPERHNHHSHHHRHGVPPAVPAAAAGATVGAALAGRDRRRDAPGPVNMPSGPPDPTGILHDSSGSETRHRPRPSGARDLAAAGAAVSAGHHSGAESGLASPPVSVKVKMHNDGRHVTLRRLSEQEAAAEREERDRSRQSGSKHHSRHRRGSGSEFSATEGASGTNWRRAESLERRQAAEAEAERQAEGGGPGSIPPPPMPGPASGALTTPGPPPTYDGHASEVTGAPRSESNRRRRRAERSQHYREGSQVEWS